MKNSAVWQFIRNRSFRTRMLLLAFVVNLIVITVFMSVYYRQATRILQNEIIRGTESVLSRLALDVSAELRDSVSALYRIGYNRQLREIMSKGSGISLDEEVTDHIVIGGIVDSITNAPHLRQVKIYFRNERVYTEYSSKYATINSARQFEWFDSVIDSRGAIYWTPPYKNPNGVYPNIPLVSAVRTIEDPRSDAPLAMVGVDIDISLLFKRLIMQTEKAINGNIYILNRAGVVTSAADSGLLGIHVSEIPEMEGYQIGVQDAQTTEGSVFLTQQIDDPDWRIVAQIPMDRFAKNNREIFAELVVSAVLLFGCMFLVNAAISFRLSQRLRTLLKEIQTPGNDMEKEQKSQDELIMLSRRYEEMAGQNRAMAGEIYKISLQKKDAQLSALQAQINPHFLYNQLDTINWMALKAGERNIVDALQLLSNFYRQALSRGRDVVTISEELCHVQTYMELQKLHYGDKLQLSIDLQQECSNCLTLKMLLQPLVENAILHGILEKEDSRGTVEIAVRRVEGTLQITVTDDGVGVPEEVLNQLRQGKPVSKRKGGYGYGNVAHRIKVYFGEAFGLSIQNLDTGCRVTVTLPVVYRPQEPWTADQS